MLEPQKLVLKKLPTAERHIIDSSRLERFISQRPVVPFQKPAPKMDTTPLPVKLDTTQKVVSDRFDPNLRWLIPTLKCLPIATLSTPVFTAQQAGHDVSGQTVYSAVLRVPMLAVVQEETRQQFNQLKGQNANLKSQDVVLQDYVATLSLPYLSESGEQKSIKVSGTLSSDHSYIDFSLRGDAVSLAYRLMTSDGNVEVHILASYSVWAKTDRVVKPDTKMLVRPERIAISKKLDPAMFQRMAVPVKSEALVAKRQERLAVSSPLRQQPAKARQAPGRAMGRARRLGVETRPAKRAPFKFGKGQAFQLDHFTQSDVHQALLDSIQVPTAKPATETIFFRDKNVIETKHSIHLSSQNDPQHFVILDPKTQDPIVFGDNPPWQKGHVNIGSIIKKLTRSDLNLPGMTGSKVEIYESLIESGRFIVIPKTYIVSRDNFDGKPLFAVNQLTHPEDPEKNEVIFDVGLEPDLTQEDRFLIQATLQNYVSEKTPVGQTVPLIYYDLPTDLGEKFELIWSDPLSQALQPVMDGETIFLPLTANSLTSASLMFDQLSFRSRGLYGNLEFLLPDDDIATISLWINLCRTAGHSMELKRETVNGVPKIKVKELAGREHQIRAVLGLSPDGELKDAPLSHTQILEPGGQIEVEDPHSSNDAITLSTDEQTPMHVEIDPVRYDIGDTLQGLIVTTMLMPDMEFEHEGRMRSLRDLAIEMRASDVSASRHPITFNEDTGLYHNVVLTWDMPLHLYLNPENRVCECKLTANFTDGHSIQTDWITHNYGTNPDFTIRREHFV